MSWWNIFKSDVSRLDSNGLPEMSVKVPMPGVKEPKAEGISEPVISFVECVRKNPKRFKIKQINKDKEKYGLTEYKVEDSATNQTWIASRFWLSTFETYKIQNADYLTEDEVNHLFAEVGKIYQDRYNTYKSLKETRERNRLKRIYCTQEDNK